MSKELEFEINSLAGETMATWAILGYVLDRLAKNHPDIRSSIASGFDDAASHVEHMAIKFGKTAAPEHTLKALEMVENLRAMIFGTHTEPKRDV